ncbi:MAG: hypothetical protein ABW321_10930 [Polyangiales bacterium]
MNGHRGNYVCMLGAPFLALALLANCSGEAPVAGGAPAGSSAINPPTVGTAGSGTPTLPGTAGTRAPAAGGAAAPAPGVGSGNPPAGAAGGGATPSVPVTPGAPGAPGAGGPTTGNMPCGVSKVLASNCQSCHGAQPIGGAPMPLVTLADLHAPAKTNPALKVYEISHMRMNDQARPMPPGTDAKPAGDLAMLDTWLKGGAVAGPASDATCGSDAPGGGPLVPDASEYGALVPLPGEKCYDFPVHGGQTLPDDSRYDVGDGEHYEQFYYAAPWGNDEVATRYGGALDNPAVLHHWLMFSTAELDASGTHKTSPLPTLNGVNAQLIAGWAVGGKNLTMPADVGFELPPQGTTINVQWHFYNSSGTPQSDKSNVQVCTVPKSTKKNIAAITWTGTEDINGIVWLGGPGMPPKQVSEFGGTCNPNRAGLAADEPIHIIAFWPHMHQLGTNMKATINRPDGTKEVIFDKPFDFNKQIHYLQNYDLLPGETMTTTCTFNNTTDKGVPFGESSDTEMCYLFTFSYPAHSFENNVTSLIGATNTCW